MKMEFAFDQEKIRKEGKFTIKEINEMLKKIMHSKNILQQDEKGNYIGDD